MSLDSENDYSIQDDSGFKNHSLCIEQDISKDTRNISLDNKNDYSIQVDSGSEHQTVDVKTFDYYPSNVALLQQGQLNCTQTTAIEKKSFVRRGIHVEVSLFKYFHKGLFRWFKFRNTSSDRGTDCCIDHPMKTMSSPAKSRSLNALFHRCVFHCFSSFHCKYYINLIYTDKINFK